MAQQESLTFFLTPKITPEGSQETSYWIKVTSDKETKEDKARCVLPARNFRFVDSKIFIFPFEYKWQKAIHTG
jgi:hypothetical protein